MTEYLTRRLLLALPTFVLVLFATFMTIRLVPGNIVDTMLAEVPYATEADRARLEAQLGLDEPVPTQFVKYTWNVLRGDLGESPYTNTPVMEEIKNRLPVTFEFGLYSILISLVIALPVGILSAIRQDTWSDYTARTFAILALSVPYFFTATLLVVFPSAWWGWAPPLLYKDWSDDGPIQHLYYFFFPAMLFGINLSGTVMRLTRTQMLEVLRQDYIRTAWAKGLRERAIITGHALKNALIPVVTVIGLQIPIVVAGTLILETIFNMPGIGRYFISAVGQRDYPSLQGVTLVIAFIVIASNLIVDLTYGVLDPRIRYS
jgi:peptide/nickel transport system permease protein